ncbi:hypothetical protein GOP47_0008007 [Adiantum capillus-veneris]|uniref:Lipoxygenase n=1 Tax=Adiantum capillus-veneris TaxID=13818 RepID=A0A9D4V1J7_ADICA|nr:hypothetical protein GOP47_0007708 [Adiantum capillus-veneris]KAI5078183.1 hypothetical protein GOP47_0008007 [Adiantum capillus-veneris]
MKEKVVIKASVRILSETFLTRHSHTLNKLLGYNVKLRIVSLEIDSATEKSRLSEEVVLSLGSGVYQDPDSIISLSFNVESWFGRPGAIVVTSQDTGEFFLKSVTLTLPDNSTLYFPCHSWINHIKYNKGRPRYFFSNKLCLPFETPLALRQIREDELLCVRGDGTGERHSAERIYDYTVYNDLCDLDISLDRKRPIMGGSWDNPCPRRIRTGRKLLAEDEAYEAHMNSYNKTYVPRDERFSPLKKSRFMTAGIRSFSHSIISDMERLWRNDKSFANLKEIHSLYANELKTNSDGKSPMPPGPIEVPYLTFPHPGVVRVNKDGWKTDQEFGRQRLAGSNPHVIELLRVFPPESTLDEKIYGPPKSAISAQHLEPYLEGYSVEEAMERKLLYIVDYYDMYMPYLSRIHATENRATCASRTIFYLSKAEVLLPIAIELALPPPKEGQEARKRVFTPDHSKDIDWVWHFAKAHVLTVDTTYQLSVCHWLRTHASLEPIIMSTRRHLSKMHPLHAFLDPHLKDTANLNSEGRTALISAGGRIEKNFAGGKYQMQMVCQEYKKWKFSEQSLPNDLLRRGVAVKDPSTKSGVRLLIEDYPYAADGLELWVAIREWVHDYVPLYYKDDKAVQDDKELQNWWWEIKNVGHGDHAGADWWSEMSKVEDVEEAMATILWVTSGFHASVNFGNYAYGGYVPNSPGMTRLFIPEEGTKEYEKMMEDPERFYMDLIPSQGVATITMATFESLAHHLEEEEYLGQRPDAQWTSDKCALAALEKFCRNIANAEVAINARNAAYTSLHHRAGPVLMPYTLLTPSSGGVGMTFRGVPNSISM